MSSLPFIILRSIKSVAGTTGDLVVKSELSPRIVAATTGDLVAKSELSPRIVALQP